MTGQALVKSAATDLNSTSSADSQEFVTFTIADQLFGIPVLIVQDILLPERIANIPLAPPEVRGSINLRGRIVTVIDVRVRLGLERRDIDTNNHRKVAVATPAEGGVPDASQGETAQKEADSAQEAVERVKRKQREHMMAVTVEHQNELYTLLVDGVGDVISLGKENFEGTPSTLNPVWRDVTSGVYRLEGRLMLVLEVSRLLDFSGKRVD